MPAQEYEFRSIPIDLLLLDQENARHGIKPDQEAVLQWMATEQDRSHLLGLARSIAQFGMNPADRLLVVRAHDDPTRYVVMEGNRRVSALKLLADPGKCPDEGMAERLTTLSREASATLPKTIDCVVMPSQEAAAPWVELRHTGLRGGAGIAPWNPQNTEAFRQRFSGRPLYSMATRLLGYIEQRGLLAPDELRRIPLTNLQRLLSTPEARHEMGIDFEHGEIVLLEDQGYVDRALTDTLRALAAREVKVPDIETADKRREWAKLFSDRRGWGAPCPGARAPAPPTQAALIATPGAGQVATQPGATGTTRRVPRDPSKRKGILRPGSGLRTRNNKLREVIRELWALEARKFPVAGALLLRLLIELSLDLYIDAHSISPARTLAERAKQVRDHILEHHPDDRKRVEHDLKGLEVFANDPNDLGSANTLNAVTHGRLFRLGADDLKRDADNIWPAILRLEDSL